MTKLNSIGVRAKDIDRIFADAIKRVAKGDDEFSCNAITRLSGFRGVQWKVKDFYVKALEARPEKGVRIDLLTRVLYYVGYESTDESQGFRILMLSLVKAAWRDLV